MKTTGLTASEETTLRCARVRFAYRHACTHFAPQLSRTRQVHCRHQCMPLLFRLRRHRVLCAALQGALEAVLRHPADLLPDCGRRLRRTVQRGGCVRRRAGAAEARHSVGAVRGAGGRAALLQPRVDHVDQLLRLHAVPRPRAVVLRSRHGQDSTAHVRELVPRAVLAGACARAPTRTHPATDAQTSARACRAPRCRCLRFSPARLQRWAT